MREALRAGELDDAASVETAAQVLEGLAHAHARGIVHRDVKPSNVLLAEGEGISARLLDFGLAQLAEEESLTATGDVPGTLAYVPPERLVHGESGGPPADVWAVGTMLWESLAGWHPFWNGSLLETAKRIETGAAPLAQARPDLPKPLCALVDRMLALDPAARPPAAHLAHELRDTFAERLRRRKTRTTVPELSVPLRLAAPAAAALFAGWTAAEVAFYPTLFAPLLAVIAGALMLVRPRLGLAFALAVPDPAPRQRLVRPRGRLRRRRRNVAGALLANAAPGALPRARPAARSVARARASAVGGAGDSQPGPARLPGRGGRAARGRGGRPEARSAALHRRGAAEGPRDRGQRRPVRGGRRAPARAAEPPGAPARGGRPRRCGGRDPVRARPRSLVDRRPRRGHDRGLAPAGSRPWLPFRSCWRPGSPAPSWHSGPGVRVPARGITPPG